MFTGEHVQLNIRIARPELKDNASTAVQPSQFVGAGSSPPLSSDSGVVETGINGQGKQYTLYDTGAMSVGVSSPNYTVTPLPPSPYKWIANQWVGGDDGYLIAGHWAEGAELIPTDGYHSGPEVSRPTGLFARAADVLDTINNSEPGRWAQAFPGEGTGVGALKAGLTFLGTTRGIASEAGTLGRIVENAAGETSALEPASAINGIKLNNQLTSQAIADGHAFGKHIGEFADLGISTDAQFQRHVENVINNATNTGPLSNGRSYFYDAMSNTIVIKNPNALDAGTAFRIDLQRFPNPLDYIKTLR